MTNKKPRGQITMMNILKENSSIRRKEIRNAFFDKKITDNEANSATDKEILLFKNLENQIREYFK
jgi:hypothetical protein